MLGESVRVDAERVVHVRADGSEVSIPWNDINAVLLETIDAGPAEDDLFWILETATVRYAVASETPGVEDLMRTLQDLPGFDNEAVIDASTSLEPGRFVCWRRDEA